jgi:hypothetical protein
MLNKAAFLGGSFTRVYKPSITAPTTSQIVGSRTPTITSSAFSKYGNITHASSDWQVSDAPDFNTIRWSSSDDTSNKVSITTSDLAGGDRYVRVRYKASSGVYSDWSAAVLFTSPWATGSNATLTSSTNMDINATTTITIQSGTYRFTLWGASGGGGANGAAGGGGGSVVKDVTYSTPTAVPVSIGTAGANGNGECHSNPCGTASGGSPGGGDGASGGDWRGGGGGGYSSAIGMTAAGGGGGSAGGGYATAGGQNPSEGYNSGAGYGGAGCAGVGNGQPGSSGSSGGGGGGGSHQTGNFQSACQSGNGGQNSGTFSIQYAGSGSSGANPYASSTYGRTFGSGNGGARIQKIASQVIPVVSITSNLSSTSSSTAGSSSSFSITATDTANNDSAVSYQWYVSTDGGSNYSTISGQNAQTLTRYQPFYYSDNGHKIKCRATITNSAGSNYADSTVCTLTVARNYDCNSSAVTGTITISNSGDKPSGESSDTEWGSWSPGYDDICEINGNTNSFNAGGRCGFCNGQGYQMKLELRITRSTDSTKRHWGDQTKSSSSCGRTSNFQINANGGGWDPVSDGTPTFRLMIIADGTNCLNGQGENIFAESDTSILSYSYKRRTYYYDSRP